MPYYSERKIVLHRDQLYAEVWKTPMLTLSKQYGLSDVGLRKICKRLKVPVPRMGHWQKVQHGKKVHQPPLSPLGEGEPQTVESILRERRIPEVEPEFATKVAAAIDAEKLKENRIVVSEPLDSPHLLVKQTLADFRGQKPDLVGRITSWKNGAFRADVSPEMVPRVLRILDALLEAIEKRGHQILVEKPKKDPQGYPLHRAPKIVVFGQELTVSFREGLTRFEKELSPDEKARRKKYPGLYERTEYLYRPKGNLHLQMRSDQFSASTWRDTPRILLEGRLNEIMIGFLEAALEKRSAEIQRKRAEERRREEEKRRWEEEKCRQEEEARIQDLENLVEAWHKSERVRTFLRAMKEMVIARDGGITPGSERERMFQWAEAYADSIDPVARRRKTPDLARTD